jgi:hypothetical protein
MLASTYVVLDPILYKLTRIGITYICTLISSSGGDGGKQVAASYWPPIQPPDVHRRFRFPPLLVIGRELAAA